MKIAVPVNENKRDPAVAGIFGRAVWFLIYDKETGEMQILGNDAAKSTGGAGIQAAQTVLDSGARVLLTPQCGENAAKVLLSGGVELFRSQPALSAMSNIEAFLNGKLEKLLDVHEGYHRH